jgi:hypothetical protein
MEIKLDWLDFIKLSDEELDQLLGNGSGGMRT